LNQNKKTLLLIQVLRGAASLLVVLLHITTNMADSFGQAFLGNIFLFGGSGVDVFFVLSGFIIAYANMHFLGKPAALPVFAKRRLNRIFPIYWIVITGFLILMLALPSFYRTHFDTSPSNLLSTYLLLPRHIMLNGVSWSLTNELFFYLIFTIGLFIPKPRYSFYLLIAYFIFLLVFAIAVPANPDRNAYLELLLFPMNLEFLMGVIVAVLVQSKPRFNPFLMLGLGIAWFLAGAVLHNTNVTLIGPASNQELSRVLLFGVSSFLIVYAVVTIELSRNIKVHPLLLSLGDASYSIYLIHLPIVSAYFKILNKAGISSPALVTVAAFVILLLVAALGIFVYNYIEKPLIKKLNKIY